MTFHYTVRESEYISVLTQVLKRNEAKPFRLLALLLLTVGQMSWVGYMIFFTDVPDARGRVFMAVWSLVIAGTNICFRLFRRKRATGLLRRLKNSGQLMESYWSEHTLHIDGDSVILTYGDQELACLCREITVQETDGYLLLNARGSILDIFPGPIDDRRKALLVVLSEGAKVESAPEKEPTSLPEGGKVSPSETFHFSLSGKDVLRGQVRVYQKFYLTQTVSKPITIAKYIATAALLYLTFTQLALGVYTVLAVIVCIAWNLPLLMCISPLTRRYLTAKVPQLYAVSPGDTHPFSIRVNKNSAEVAWGGIIWTMDLRQKKLLSHEKQGICLYTGSWPALFVPGGALVPQEEQALYHTLFRAGE